MNKIIFKTGLVCFMLFMMLSTGYAQQAKKKIRVGVYDNRAIATAYFGSSFNPLMSKRAEFEAAKEAGDSAKVQQLEAWGPKFQRQIQFQGFCRVPVDDLLEYVKDKLPNIAKENSLDFIGWLPNYTSSNVEIIKVDITSQLIALYNPTEKILDEVKQIIAVPPTPLGEIVQQNYKR